MAPRKPVVEILDPKMVEVLRNLTPADRLRTAFSMWESARQIIRGSVRQAHAEWNDEQIDRETARRLSHGATERVPR